MLGARELIQDVTHRRATFVLVFPGVRTPGDLTEVFLREPCDPCAFDRLEGCRARVSVTDVLPAAVEAFHDECALIAELTDVRVRDRQSQLLQQRRAQPLVIDGMRQVEPAVTDQSQRKFQNVRRRGGTQRLVPMPAYPGQCGLLLCTRE